MSNKKLKELHAVLAEKLLKKVKDPKPYGVVLGKRIGKFYNITQAIEKPKKFISNLAIMPVNSFNYKIFNIENSYKIASL